MKRFAIVLGVVVVAGALSLRAADKDDEVKDDAKGKVAAAAVKKQADAIAKGGTWETHSKEGAALAKAHILEHVMRTMKVRRSEALKIGLGIGEKPGTVMPDGIEAQFTVRMPNWEKLPDNFKDLKADYIRATHIMAAVASISIHQCKVDTKKGDKDPKEWKEWSEKMYQESLVLAKALEKEDFPAIKASAQKLSANCSACHTPFRFD